MNALPAPEMTSFLRDGLAGLGLKGEPELHQLTGGLNNRVYRVCADGSGPLLLKHYFSAPGDPRNRLATEFEFLRLAWGQGIRCIPEPVAMFAEYRLALFGFVEGRPVSAAGLSKGHVEQALQFFLALNMNPTDRIDSNIGDASDACFSISDHLGSLERRLSRVLEIDGTTDIERDAKEFLKRDILPLWDAIRRDTERLAKERNIEIDQPIPEASRCLSPSDFGFHNALQKPDGTIVFLDFEYAGIDDPAKTVCDFFSQEAVQVPQEHFRWFASAVADAFSLSDADRMRIEQMLPVHRLKWVCMILQEFLPEVLERRMFATARFDRDEHLVCRLGRARELAAGIASIGAR